MEALQGFFLPSDILPGVTAGRRCVFVLIYFLAMTQCITSGPRSVNNHIDAAGRPPRHW